MKIKKVQKIGKGFRNFRMNEKKHREVKVLILREKTVDLKGYVDFTAWENIGIGYPKHKASVRDEIKF